MDSVIIVVVSLFYRIFLIILHTGRADSKKKHLMPFRNKTWRNGLFFVQSTPRDFKEMVAGMAMEIMMMLFPRPFIENAHFRMVDNLQPPGLNQGFKISIYSCPVKRSHRFPTHMQDFINPERSIYRQKSPLNRIFLNGLSFHFHLL